jgi:hypothetical protein
MPAQTHFITIPEVKLTIDQLFKAVRQLDDSSRSQLARVLMETEMDAKLQKLIQDLAKAAPASDISDDDIESEIKAFRMERVAADAENRR